MEARAKGGRAATEALSVERFFHFASNRYTTAATLGGDVREGETPAGSFGQSSNSHITALFAFGSAGTANKFHKGDVHMKQEAAVVPFRFESQEIRTVVKDGEPWFVLSDICEILGLDQVSRAASRIPDNHRTLTSIKGVDGRPRETNIISEGGLYRLVLRSDKPNAEPFIEWVTSEVLPTIRKTGKYAMRPVMRHREGPDRQGRMFEEAYYKHIRFIIVTYPDGSIWISAKEFFDALGYAQPTERVMAMGSRIRGVNGLDCISSHDVFHTLSRSRKDEAVQFKQWFIDNVAEPYPSYKNPTPLPAQQPATADNILNAAVMDKMRYSRFLLSFNDSGGMVLEEVLGYRVDSSFPNVPKKIKTDTFMRRSDLPPIVIQEVERI